MQDRYSSEKTLSITFMHKNYDVVAISQAIVDLFAHVSDDFFKKHGLEKGTTIHIDKKSSDNFLNELNIKTYSAGSAPANTLSALSALGAKTGMISRICRDDLGKMFRDSLHEQGIYFSHGLCEQGLGTGRSLILISDDIDRTMLTYLGTANEFSKNDMDEDLIQDAKYILFEAYQFASPQMLVVTEAALQKAKASGAKIVLGAAHPACLIEHREKILEFIAKYIDIFAANEAEVKALFYCSEEVEPKETDLLEHLDICLMTQGARGSTIFSRSEGLVRAKRPQVEKIFDTTGAGDHYLAGFLYGLLQDFSMQDAANLAAQVSGSNLHGYGGRVKGSLQHLVK